MRQKLGQHFLTSPAVATAIAAALDIQARDTILEIGPGHGELTQAIVRKIDVLQTREVKIVAVEKDPTLAAEFRKRFKNNSEVEVVVGDALIDLPAITTALQPGYKLAGNIPYYITGHLLRLIGELESKPELAVLMLQKEVAERLAAAVPHMNRLAAAVQFWAEPHVLRVVNRREFSPAPAVDSAVVVLRSKEEVFSKNAAGFYKMVRVLFAHPRKTALNNLKEGLATQNISPQTIMKLLESCEIPVKARPQDLNLAMIEKLALEVDKIA